MICCFFFALTLPPLPYLPLQIRPYPWTKIFRPRDTTPEAIDLISSMLQYVPTMRVTALEACAHPFFDELRQPDVRLPDDVPLPALFNWSESELSGASPELRLVLVPPHARCPEWTSVKAMDANPPFGSAGSGTGAPRRDSTAAAASSSSGVTGGGGGGGGANGSNNGKTTTTVDPAPVSDHTKDEAWRSRSDALAADLPSARQPVPSEAVPMKK